MPLSDHYLNDIEAMSPDERARRCDELIGWTKRLSDQNANPQWVLGHICELARLAEMMREKPLSAVRRDTPALVTPSRRF